MRWMLMAWVVCCGFAVAEDTDTPASPLPLDHFTRPDEFADLKLSPDGGHLAFTTSKDGRTILVCAVLGDSKSSGGIRMPDRSQITEFHWVSPTRLIYFTQQVRNAAGLTGTAEIFSVDHECQKPLKLHDLGDAAAARPKFLGRIASQPDMVLIAEHRARTKGASLTYDNPNTLFGLLSLNVQTGERRSFGSLPLAGAKVLFDRDAALRFIVGYQGSELQMLWRPAADAEWQTIEIPELLTSTIEPRALSLQGDQVWLTAAAPGAAHVGLYRFNPAQKKTTLVHAFEGTDVAAVLQDLAGSGDVRAL